MNNRIYIVLLLLLFNGCQKDFELINTDPNGNTIVQPELLLRQVLYDYGEQMSYEGFVAGNLLGQYLTQIDFNLFDRHSLSEPQFGGNPWPVFYKNLRDNELLLVQAQTNATYELYEGPALILKAYIAAALTDIYGDVPYSEALSGLSGNTTPVYDSQELIYTGENGILANLQRGVELLSEYAGAQTIQGDILFNGNIEAWIKFGNAIRIKSLIRISDRVDVAAELQLLYDAGLFISSNAENASFDFTDGPPNNFRMATLRDGDFNLFVMSQTSEDLLNNDPRQAKFFRPTGNDAAVYEGLINGPDASITSISVADYSLAGSIFREETSALDANFLTAWEVSFLLAEAAERGLISADAKDLYEQGITQAFEYWQTDLPSGFLERTEVVYGADNLRKIASQKWIANTINGYESWIEYRRTGYPEFYAVEASLNEDLIPIKMPYPTDEAALNTVNYNTVAGANNNSVNIQVWWDVD